METTVNYLTRRLSNFKDSYSVELCKALKSTDISQAINNISIKPREPFLLMYDVGINMALSEVLFD